MRNLILLLIAAAAQADAPKPPSSEELLVARLETAHFSESTTPNAPKGSMGATLGVDPVTKGATTYARTPAGTGLPAHWHSATEYTVLLGGKGTLTIEGKQYEVTPGSYFVIPANLVHQLTCATGADCLLLTRRGGPVDYHFVK